MVSRLVRKDGTLLTQDQVQNQDSSSCQEDNIRLLHKQTRPISSTMIWISKKREVGWFTWPMRGISSSAKGEITSTVAPASSQVSLIAPSAADSPTSR